MANYGGTDPGRTGPYWRRQQHNTLPGEWTGAELAAINGLRGKMGLPPLGGPALHTAQPAGGGRVAMPFNPGPPRPFVPGAGFPGGGPIGGPPPEQYPRGGGVGPMPGEPGAAPPGVVASAPSDAYGPPHGPPGGVLPPIHALPGGQLGQLQLPQLLALKAMFAKATGQQPRPAMPAQRSVLPQLHQAVPVRAHVRIVPPRPVFAPSNRPAYKPGPDFSY